MPHKIWFRLVQPFWRLLYANRQTNFIAIRGHPVVGAKYVVSFWAGIMVLHIFKFWFPAPTNFLNLWKRKFSKRRNVMWEKLKNNYPSLKSGGVCNHQDNVGWIILKEWPNLSKIMVYHNISNFTPPNKHLSANSFRKL